MALWGQCQFSLPCVEIQLILLLELFSDPCQGARQAAHLVFEAGTQRDSASLSELVGGAGNCLEQRPARTASLAAALEQPPKLQHQHTE